MIQKLSHITGHARYACALTLLLSPVFSHFDLLVFLPSVGIVLGILNELFDGHRWSWFDVADFTVAGCVTSFVIAFLVGKIGIEWVLFFYGVEAFTLWLGDYLEAHDYS